MNDHSALYKSSRLQYCICTSSPQIAVEIDMKKMQLSHQQKWSHSSELLSVTLPVFLHDVFLLNSSRRGMLLSISLEYMKFSDSLTLFLLDSVAKFSALGLGTGTEFSFVVLAEV